MIDATDTLLSEDQEYIRKCVSSSSEKLANSLVESKSRKENEVRYRGKRASIDFPFLKKRQKRDVVVAAARIPRKPSDVS